MCAHTIMNNSTVFKSGNREPCSQKDSEQNLQEAILANCSKIQPKTWYRQSCEQFGKPSSTSLPEVGEGRRTSCTGSQLWPETSSQVELMVTGAQNHGATEHGARVLYYNFEQTKTRTREIIWKATNRSARKKFPCSLHRKYGKTKIISTAKRKILKKNPEG
jgi:hypothetical protein